MFHIVWETTKASPDYYAQQNYQTQSREKEKVSHDKINLNNFCHQSSSVQKAPEDKLRSDGKVNYTQEKTRNK